MKSMFTLGAAIGALSLAAAAGAEAPGRSFSQLDRNQDSLVSVAEAQADSAVGSAFTRVDANGDGFVSRGEFSNWRGGVSGERAAPSSRGTVTPPGPQNNPEIDSTRPPDAGNPRGQ